MMQNEPRVWPKVGDAGKSGVGAVPLRSAQMMGQQKKKKKKKKSVSHPYMQNMNKHDTHHF